MSEISCEAFYSKLDAAPHAARRFFESINFLVIAYQEMRAIKAEINKRRGEPDRALRGCGLWVKP